MSDVMWMMSGCSQCSLLHRIASVPSQHGKRLLPEWEVQERKRLKSQCLSKLNLRNHTHNFCKILLCRLRIEWACLLAHTVFNIRTLHMKFQTSGFPCEVLSGNSEISAHAMVHTCAMAPGLSFAHSP